MKKQKAWEVRERCGGEWYSIRIYDRLNEATDWINSFATECGLDTEDFEVRAVEG